MKIAATEALWETDSRAPSRSSRSAGSRRTTRRRASIEIPKLLSLLATGSLDGKVVGINELQRQAEAQYGPGNYTRRPDDLLGDADHGLLRHAGLHRAALGGFLYWRGSSSRSVVPVDGVARSPCRTSPRSPGWVLTEIGRQPWIVWGSLKTEVANSPSVARRRSRRASASSSSSTRTARGRLRLMRRYARLDPPERGRRGRRVAAPGGELLMDLEVFWFCVVAVCWAAYFVLEGFDFGVGMLLPFLPRHRATRRTRCSGRSARSGRKRGVARRRRRARRLPRSRPGTRRCSRASTSRSCSSSSS